MLIENIALLYCVYIEGHLFASSLSHDDTNLCQTCHNNSLDHINHQGETFDCCGAVKEYDSQIPFSQDETRKERREKETCYNGNYRQSAIPCTTIILQPSSRKQDDPLLYLTNQQYQLTIKVKGQTVFITVKLKATDDSRDKHELEKADHIKYWKDQLTQLGLHSKAHISSHTPVIVSYCSIPALVDMLTAQGFEMVRML